MGVDVRGILGQAGTLLLQALPGGKPGRGPDAGSFLKALQNRELLDSFNQRQCKAWLFATARNLYCDQLRRKMKEESLIREMLPEGDEEPPDETAEAALGTVDLETLLELLDPLDRAMFTLRYEEGYNASELSKIFHLPPGTVRTRLRKARTLLKHELLEE